MASRPLVVHVVGARPNYMKVAPVYAALERRGNVEQRLIHTGQHYDAIMKDVFFAELPLPRPHVAARRSDDSRTRLIETRSACSPTSSPSWSSWPATSTRHLPARSPRPNAGITVCHIESGLRSGDWSMPEERNRVITDHLSTLLLTHSDDANKNLVAEALTARISFVGNTMIDTLRANEGAALELEAWREFGLEPGRYVLVTLHRPSLVDDPDLLARTIAALDDVAESLPVIFPVHPRTRKNLDGSTRVLLTEPLPYRQFLSLEAKAAAVVTDSGGIQEETTVLRIPCFTLRENTERPITIELGTNTLLGLEPERLRELPDAARGAEARPDPAALGWAGGRTGSRRDRTPRGRSHGLKVWVDMTASAHVLVFRPLIQLLRERGDEVEITARDYAQTLQLLELHGLEATVDRPPRRTFAARQGTLAHLAPARAAQVGAAARLRPRAGARLARAHDDVRAGSASRARRRTTTSSRRCSTSSACAPRRRWSCRTRSPPSGSHTSASSRRSFCAIPA